MTLQPFAVAPVVGLLAATPAAGFPLVNGTPTVITWTAPNDGQLHRFMVFCSMIVASLETGGGITVNYTTPDGSVNNHSLFNAGLAAGEPLATNPALIKVVKPGTVVSVTQSSALTAGGPSTLWAEIWGS